MQSHLENWKRWGPYLAERQWGTVREDYSHDGSTWNYFPHDHARSRVYRWGEDGLLGISDRQGRLCFALALWNHKDPILKERLFGLTGPEGNHGEDVKECYYYLDSTPTHSYMKGLYKYPQREFPYARLVEENRRRGVREAEFELADTGVFEGGRYFDIFVEYAKATAEDILIRITAHNRGTEPAPLDILPTVWFRNTWSWGRDGEGYWPKPLIRQARDGVLELQHASLRTFQFAAHSAGDQAMGAEPARFLFTENETNMFRLFGTPNGTPCVKDGFHEYLIQKNQQAISAEGCGTKAAAHYSFVIPGGESRQVWLRLSAVGTEASALFGANFENTFTDRIREADEFFATRRDAWMSMEEARIQRQGYAGLLWSKQFYYYHVADWLEGDPSQPPAPASRLRGRNFDWAHLYNRDVISMPDKWEYPWYAAWDLAFHMIPFASIDPVFAKEQVLLFLREWYMHPNGQIPAYEFAFSDVNPPVHAWAAWRVYKMTGARGQRDLAFLARVFHKLMLNFTWWVNRKDLKGNHIFSGGFLGLDNIGVFDRSQPLPMGGHLEQADGTAWMAFYCGTMLSMALELSRKNPVYEDVASKFFEHFVAIIDAMNSFDGTGLWDEQDGFYYDHLHIDGKAAPLRLRSLVGLIPLIAVEVLEADVVDRLHDFRKRMLWFLTHRKDLARHVTSNEESGEPGDRGHYLLALPSKARLERLLSYLVNEDEFLSPHGIRSMSRAHEKTPFQFRAGDQDLTVSYTPGESTTTMFGGNSNWRGPVWLPVNYLIVEALERYHFFYGDSFKIECPAGSGQMKTLREVAEEINSRLTRLFLPDRTGRRPCHGDSALYAKDPHWRELIHFHEYFHGNSGLGLGASHQTGWTALVVKCLESLALRRERAEAVTV